MLGWISSNFSLIRPPKTELAASRVKNTHIDLFYSVSFSNMLFALMLVYVIK